jgi:hypothetical protein
VKGTCEARSVFQDIEDVDPDYQAVSVLRVAALQYLF